MVIDPIVKVRVVPASTYKPKKPLKKNTFPVTTAVTPVLMAAEALVMASELLVGVYPLKVSCRDPPAGITCLLTMVKVMLLAVLA